MMTGYFKCAKAKEVRDKGVLQVHEGKRSKGMTGDFKCTRAKEVRDKGDFKCAKAKEVRE